MTLIKHELRQGRVALTIWTAGIGALIAVCIFLYPEMQTEMDSMSAIFASMGSFTAAFGMDRLGFGTLMGFYAVECGSILGLGGAFFASLLAVQALSKEERDHTAEFLLTHPVTRTGIMTEKLAAVLLQILILNAILFGLSAASVAAIGETVPWKELGLLHLAAWLLQIELAGICFGISAFVRRGGAGIGLGVAIVLYFLNLVANISDRAHFLKYITPFGYTEGADILTSGHLDLGLVLLGMGYAAVGIAAAYWRYSRKDIR